MNHPALSLPHDQPQTAPRLRLGSAITALFCSAITALFCSALLCACAPPHAFGPQHGNSPHPMVLTEERAIIPLAQTNRQERDSALAAALDMVGTQDVQIDLYAGKKITAAQRADIVQSLRRQGVADSAIHWLPGADAQFDLQLRRSRAVAQACPEQANNLDGRWMSAQTHTSGFGCSVNANLGAQLANPYHLTQPENLAAPNPISAVSAVEAYQRGEVAPLRQQEFAPGNKQK